MSRNKSKFTGLLNKAKYLASDLTYDDQIEIHSNRYVLITGCRKLTEYSKEKVSLSFKDMDVEITGYELEPESLLNGQMALKGVIRGVNYVDH